MKIQVLFVLAATASLFAQAPATTTPAPAAATPAPVATTQTPAAVTPAPADISAAISAATAPPVPEQLPCRASFETIKNTYPRDAAADRMFALVEARVRTLEATPKDDRKGKLYETELRSCGLAVELFRTQLNKVALQRSVDSLNEKNIITQKLLSSVKDSLVDLWSREALGAKSLNAFLSDERARLEKLNKEKASELNRMASQSAEAERRLDALNSKVMSVYRDARGTIISLSDILFDFGKATLKQDLKDNLTEVAAILKTLMIGSNVEIEGHTDNVGNAKKNETLSKQRADAVMKHLVQRGVDKNHLKAVGYGLTRPIADNSTAEGRAKNRRVELVIREIPK